MSKTVKALLLVVIVNKVQTVLKGINPYPRSLYCGVRNVTTKLKSVSPGRYCEESKRWRSSFSCKLFGSICLLSSECSIFMMTLITLHRLISVLLPRKISTLGRGRSLICSSNRILILVFIILYFSVNSELYVSQFLAEYFRRVSIFYLKPTLTGGLIAWYVAIVMVWVLVLCLAWIPNMHVRTVVLRQS